MTELWVIFLLLYGIGFYVAAFTDEGEKLAESLSGAQAFLCSGAGGLVFGFLLSYPANGCADAQCTNILGSATISQDDAIGVAAVFGLFTGLIGLFYRFVAMSRKLEREKATQEKHDRQSQTEIEVLDCPMCGERIRLTTHAASCPRCGGKLTRSPR